MKESLRYKVALTIAGSDPSGGAGIQTDLKTFSALGCYGMSVITALTAQNTSQVRSIHAPDAQFIGEQLAAVLDDIKPDAVKLGMLFNQEIVIKVASMIRDYALKNAVLDPVMISKSGNALLDEAAVRSVIKELFPLAAIVTPNIPETCALLNRQVTHTRSELEKAAAELLEFGASAVLIKGGHTEGKDCEDYFLERGGNGAWITHSRINTKNTHGTGCTLSSAIAAHLALGNSLFDSVVKARDFLQRALEAGSGYSIGEGHGPPHVLWPFWS